MITLPYLSDEVPALYLADGRPYIDIDSYDGGSPELLMRDEFIELATREEERIH